MTQNSLFAAVFLSVDTHFSFQHHLRSSHQTSATSHDPVPVAEFPLTADSPTSNQPTASSSSQNYMPRRRGVCDIWISSTLHTPRLSSPRSECSSFPQTTCSSCAHNLANFLNGVPKRVSYMSCPKTKVTSGFTCLLPGPKLMDRTMLAYNVRHDARCFLQLA